MSLHIVQYPHPALAHVSKPLRRVDDQLRGWVREMFDLMYAADGIGLAANQVALPYRVFVLNLTSDPQQPDQERVLLNPVIHRRRGNIEGEEGCLSLPGLRAPVRRSETIQVSAYGLDGSLQEFEAEGLLARAIQHEHDHLDGTLIIDRLTPTARLSVKEEIEEFEIQYRGQLERGELPGPEEVARQLAQLESQRT